MFRLLRRLYLVVKQNKKYFASHPALGREHCKKDKNEKEAANT